jgi:hypothetical protein
MTKRSGKKGSTRGKELTSVGKNGGGGGGEESNTKKKKPGKRASWADSSPWSPSGRRLGKRRRRRTLPSLASVLEREGEEDGADFHYRIFNLLFD